MKEFIKKAWDKIKEPHGVWLAIFYVAFVVFASGSLALVVFYPNQTALHYVMYALAAATLAYFVYTIVYFAPKVKAKIISAMKGHEFTNNILSSYGYRTIVFAVVSFLINVAYVAFMAVMAALSDNAWYYAIAVYYVLLALTKGNVFLSKLKSNEDIFQAKAYRASGILLILFTLAFSGVITLVYKSGGTFEYAGVLIYAVAAFTFYKLVMAAINFVKAKKSDDLYVRNLRNVNFAGALISLVSLQVAMFQAFSPEANSGFANALTGAGVSAVIVAVGVIMVVVANKKIKLLVLDKEKEK